MVYSCLPIILGMRIWGGLFVHTARGAGPLISLSAVPAKLLFKPVEEFALADFDRMVAVDLRAVFVATRMAVSHKRDGGRTIIGSTIVDYAALPMTSLERNLEFFRAVPLKHI
jgi:NAD(P)-dependent dehydrogenase (short-subunit alcohol dehydrogenase family)